MANAVTNRYADHLLQQTQTLANAVWVKVQCHRPQALHHGEWEALSICYSKQVNLLVTDDTRRPIGEKAAVGYSWPSPSPRLTLAAYNSWTASDNRAKA